MSLEFPPEFPPELIDHLDRILEGTACSLSIEGIGDLIFGGLAGWSRSGRYFDDVIEAGTALRQHEGVPLAVPVPPGIGFFLVAWPVERLQDQKIMEGARGIEKVGRRIEKIERRHGAGDDVPTWSVDEAPPAWQAATREWERIADGIFVDALRPYAADMAALFVADLEEFGRRRETGRRNFARLLGRDDILEPFAEVLAENLENGED